MGDTRHKIIIRMETENGNVVSASFQKVGADGKKAFQDLEYGARGVDHRLTLLGETIAKRVVPALSLAVFGRSVEGAIKSMADLDDQAKKLKINVEELQKLRFIARDIGLDDTAADAAFGAFIQKVGEAQQGVGKLLPLLNHYKIAVRDANGENRAWEEILQDISRVISSTDSAQEQMFIASRTGMDDFLDVLRKGPAEFDRLREEAVNAGVVIEEDIIDSAALFDKEWEHYTELWYTSFKRKIVEIANSLSDLSSKLAGEGPLSSLEAIEKRVTKVRSEMGTGPFSKINDFFRKGELSSLDRRKGELQREPEYMLNQNMKKLEDSAHIIERLRTRQKFNVNNGSLAESEEAATSAKKTSEESIRLSEKEAEKIKDIIETLKHKNQIVGLSSVGQEVYNKLREAGTSIDSAAGKEIESLVRQLDAAEQATKRLERASEALGQAWASNVEDMIFEGKEFKDFLGSLGEDIARILYRDMVGDPLAKSVSSVAKDFLPDLFSFGEGWPKFASGGSFTVGGRSGVDKNPVQFWATKGERVTVETAEQQRSGSSIVVNNYGSSQVSVREDTRGGNSRVILDIADEATARAVTTKGSRTHAALLQFGQQSMTRRG